MPGPPPSVSDYEIIQAVALQPAPIVVASDLVDELDMTRQGVNKRLNQLVDDGLLHQKNVGSSAKVYWLSDAGRELLADPRSGQDNQ